MRGHYTSLVRDNREIRRKCNVSRSYEHGPVPVDTSAPGFRYHGLLKPEAPGEVAVPEPVAILPQVPKST